MKLLGISAKKQGGKNTTANFIVGLYMLHLGIVRGRFSINPEGQLYVSDIFGDSAHEGIFDIQRQDNENFIAFRQEYLDPYIRLYSYADWLKSIAINVFGIEYKQCYGSDKDKNSLTHLKWEDMPEVVSIKTYENQGAIETGELTYHEPGPITAREFLQYFGTDICRKISPNCWVDSIIKQIQKDNPEYAIICDVRFPNEVFGVKDAGGKTLRLTRNVAGKDEHESEKALDKDRFDWSNFDIILDNQEQSIDEQCDAVYNLLQPIGYTPLELKEEQYVKN